MAYSDGDTASQLTAVRTAIDEILTSAQSYSVSGRSARKAELAQLFEREEVLETRLARETGAFGFRVGRITHPRNV